MNWPHNTHTTTRKSPRYIFTILWSFFFFFLNFKSSITHLIFTFITYYYFAKRRPYFYKSKLHIYIYFIIFVTFFLFFNIVFLKIQPLLQVFNLCFWVFVINFVPLRIQSSVPIFTWERDYWLDCSLPLWTLLFLHQVTCISSLPLLFSTQLCESLCSRW